MLDDAGMEHGIPEISLGSRAGECATEYEEVRPTAFHCEGTIHMPRQWVLSDLGVNEESHLVLLAHEYGHHVQRLSGVLRASAERADESAESFPESLRGTRRKELQAECFAGMFVARAVEDGLLDRRRAVRLVETPGSAKMADTHGSPANQRRWRKAGFREGSTSACATWTAPNDAVR
ncbi:neutral zinc metallopeptidase [Actinopolyspora saharensis]|uniref:neutral zinc metallopeptidase n=1 Tax=Actinopolyspora saharensis TaxID=995062 RepID=UPI001FE1DAC0|nr:neutral zinc metallopeptidase [Actinopolyspora saharensis]